MMTYKAARSHRKWTPEEIEYLSSNWGTVSYSGICRKLGRSEQSIRQKAYKLGLGPFIECGDYVTLHQVSMALGFGWSSDKYFVRSWGRRGCPIRNKRRGRASIRVIFLDDFWKWAEKNRSFLDFSKMAPLALGKEPPWVAAQREKDRKSCALQRKDAWTPEEDAKLIAMLKEYRYGYAEISETLHRSTGAIARRCRDLGLKERPIREHSGAKENRWTTENTAALENGIRNGDSYMLIGKTVGKSEKAVRGKVYNTYRTEDADKVRAMMKDGPWGHGAPDGMRKGGNIA